MNQTFKAGDRVFSIQGQEGEYIARAPGMAGHLVAPLYDSPDDREPHFDAATNWPEVFTAPPTERLQRDVATLESRRQRVSEELRQLRDQQAAMERTDRDRMARLKQNKQLRRIDDWLAGNITHFVVWERYSDQIVVKTRADLMSNDRRSYRAPLLVLYGTLETDENVVRSGVEWARVDNDKEIRVIPCASEAEAREQAAKALAHAVERWRIARKNRGGSSSDSWRYDRGSSRLVADLQALGLPVPDDVTADATELRRQALVHAVAEAAKKSAEARTAEAAAQAELQSLSTPGVPA